MLRIGSIAGRAGVTLLVGATVLALGCGDSTGLARRYPIKGTVTYKGEPVSQGTITFSPVNPAEGRAATGTITDGSYYLTTAVDGDGALPGDYKVSVLSTEVDLSAAAANVQGGSMRQDDVAKANREAKNLVPAKYGLPDTSGLTYKVEGSTNSANFDLTD